MITGIIAELNPLHKGHKALITSVSAKSRACVVILSSNFTQRGSPAIVDKFIRAEMAMNAGADLVIELPTLYSCSAGPDFSRGAIDLLGRTHLATHIAFGMETPEYDCVSLIEAMNTEEYSRNLKHELSLGASYAKANAIALEKLIPGSGEFITKPNNMLAVSYMKANRWGLEVMPVKRAGDYRSSVIREDISGNSEMMPEYVNEMLSCGVCDEGKLWPLLQSVLLRSRAEDLRKIYGIDEGIENLFLREWKLCRYLHNLSLENFIGRCVCARYTRAHIRRRLIYILLGLDRWEVYGALRRGVPYARVLAFNGRGRKLLHDNRGKSEVKIVTRLKEGENYFADIEFRASRLYELLTDRPEINRVLQFP